MNLYLFYNRHNNISNRPYYFAATSLTEACKMAADHAQKYNATLYTEREKFERTIELVESGHTPIKPGLIHINYF